MNPVRAWNAFWFGPISARPLGAFRVAFGLIALANLGLMAVDLDYWYTDAGLFQGPEAGAIAGSLRYSPLNRYQSPATVHAVFAATAVAAVGVTLGWRTRLTSALFYLGTLALHHRNLASNAGPDVLLMVLSFYLMLSPAGAAYSLDARRAARKRGTRAEPLIVPWAQRLIQCQVALVYFVTAVWKCHGSSWLGGTALHYVLNNTEFHRFNLDPLLEYPLAINVLTYAGLLTEFGLAFLLWFRATRPWVLWAGLGLHVGVLFVVNVPIFGELMVACYLTFLGPDELDALFRHLNPTNWWGRSRRAALVRGRIDGASTLPAPHASGPVPASTGVA